MQKNHPKSGALRQTKICMAAAAVVTAAALPGYAVAEQVPAPEQWETDRNTRVSAIQQEISSLKADLEMVVATHKFAEKISAQMNSVLLTIDGPVKNEDKRNLLEILSANVDYLLKAGDTGLTVDGAKKKGELVELKSKIDAAVSVIKTGSRQAIGQALDELDAELKTHASFLKDSADALAPQQRVTDILRAKEQRVKGVASEEALTTLKNTRQLDATTPGAATTGGQQPWLTWSDKNLTNFMGDEATDDTHNVLTKDSILELTSASGDASDALHGADENKRDIGTLHVAQGATHHVAVNGGELTVHKGIEGDGDLSVLVNADGKLIFADDSVGIDGEMEGIALFAGRTEAATGTAGKIEFGKNTSSGQASIVLFEGAELTFAENSNAGTSVIDINQGASATFDKASALVSSISNSGTLGFEGSKLGMAELVNDSASLVGIINSDLEEAEIINLGIIAIENSKGGDARIINGIAGQVSIKDTALENLTLINTGTVGVSGNSTAHGATIDMNGGVFSIADVNVAGADAAPEKTLTIGSLSGHGDVFTGDTKLVLGALNQNDHFEGKISRQAEPLAPEQEEASALPSLMHSDLAADESTKASVGSELAKVGTGNLTLSGDQSGVARLSVDSGTLTAAHSKALGAGTVTIGEKGAVALNKDVTGVTDLANAGALNLGTNKLSVERYSSTEGATIKSRVEKAEGKLVGGKIHVSDEGDFTNTNIGVDVATDIELSEIVGHFDVVQADGDAKVTGGEVKVGSITGGKKQDPIITTPEEPTTEPGTDTDTGTETGTKITDKSVVNFLAADGGYTANERAVLASVDGVT
ncbi:hypothetical protein, partial [Pandoraea fibrosis]|uniref:hypothetical protein n=1 Tax=Pandoraea fibrosis TaxID=1891094 RepID=UPI00123F928A